MKVQQNGVNEYHWSAQNVVTANNETYVPLWRSGVLRPGQGITINYYLVAQTQALQPSPWNQYVTFIVRGLPPSEKATIIVEGIAYNTDSTLVVSTWAIEWQRALGWETRSTTPTQTGVTLGTAT